MLVVCWEEVDMAIVLLCQGSTSLGDWDVPWKDRQRGEATLCFAAADCNAKTPFLAVADTAWIRVRSQAFS